MSRQQRSALTTAALTLSSTRSSSSTGSQATARESAFRRRTGRCPVAHAIDGMNTRAFQDSLTSVAVGSALTWLTYFAPLTLVAPRTATSHGFGPTPVTPEPRCNGGMLSAPVLRPCSKPAGSRVRRRYERHCPEETILYGVVERHHGELFAQLGEEGRRVPGFVGAEFEAYLRCGWLEHGFVRVKCEGCRHEHLVAFSCKGRGF